MWRIVVGKYQHKLFSLKIITNEVICEKKCKFSIHSASIYNSYKRDWYLLVTIVFLVMISTEGPHVNQKKDWFSRQSGSFDKSWETTTRKHTHLCKISQIGNIIYLGNILPNWELGIIFSYSIVIIPKSIMSVIGQIK